MQFVRDLMQGWPSPDSTIQRARSLSSRIWIDQDAKFDRSTSVIGQLWVGAGRQVPAGATIVGPCVMWDDPAKRPAVESLAWEDIEPSLSFVRQVTPRRRTSISRAAKRLFDIVFALVALAITLPIYPFVMLAIWLEDRAPFFFAHRRETLGGREFGCLKFRSMRRDAGDVKVQLAEDNQADGPQFFMDDDPRITRVGRFIRWTYIDELPQFFNVLLGHMSVVGPRPSPQGENQFCPPWREARLSVRPGITGLWQVKRTRRRGCDFQEWIKYDIEYVESVSWMLDLKIIWQTFLLVIRRLMRS
jgi:lipopolysaccharide/colanic/teichoic acid biosynthesis glycosyltransferase